MGEDDLATRRKRLRYRSARLGTRELDLFLGSFAERHLDRLAADALDRYEAILEANENDIYDWLAGRRPVPPEHDNEVMALLLNFRFLPAPS
jgi:antitoxin CptB